MPTYEYRCSKGHHFELFQRISEPPVDRCPECGASAERLLSSGAGLIFKGSGFYITDYRSDTYKKAARADDSGGKSESSSKDSAGGASASKPESKNPSSGTSKSE
ncbi:MAG TPA: zinc ribbon domain-containing protein [Longimicrobiales bacterium]|nr:zinc ribbon domain-containing protein [Longimicrobiales bacterium]